MTTQIFVNLPCKDLPKSKAFFESLGYDFNPQFTDDKGACMVVSDTIYVMLLTREFFGTFIKKPVADAHQTIEAITCLSLDSRQAVDDIHARALRAGATSGGEPQDYGFMYSRAFQDLDGHQWEFVHMSGEPPQA
jgi:predicted lactoylglutathione lyase